MSQQSQQVDLCDHDIIIAGGGLSGLLTAFSLANIARNQEASQTCDKQLSENRLRIAIVEPQPIKHETIEHNTNKSNTHHGLDARVLALSHGTACYLNELGIWSVIEKYAQPIERIHISDRGHYGKARIAAKEHQVNALGYVIEMALLGKALYNMLSSMKNVTWYCPNTIKQVQWQHDSVQLTLDNNNTISAKLLLGCDGAQSICRQFANIGVTEKLYQQSAIICNVKMAKVHNNVAYERFTNQGPIAVLPMRHEQSSNNYCSIVWTLSPAQAKFHVEQSEKAFKQALQQAFGAWLGEVTAISERFMFPLSLVQANEQVFHRMALVGNASHTIHPIAGQGFNLGVRDISTLTRMIAKQWQIGHDIGQFAMLNSYAEDRKRDHQAVIQLTDSLVTLFSNELPPLVVGRNVGLKILNYLSPLKRAFVSKTMGY